MDKPKRDIERERERLERYDREVSGILLPFVSPQDRQYLRRLDRVLTRREDIGDRRHRDLLRRNRIIAEHWLVIRDRARELAHDPTRDVSWSDIAFVGVSSGFEEPVVATAVVDWITGREEGYESQSKRDAYRQWARNVLDAGMPDHIEEIDAGTHDVEKRPHPNDFVDLDEVQAMIEACNNPRDRALIAVAFECGPRPGELYDMERRHVLTDEEGPLRLQFFGKEYRQRTVSMRILAHHVAEWLEYHPSEDPHSPLWGRLSTSGYDEGEPISRTAFLNVFKSAAEEAGVQRKLESNQSRSRVTPENLRRSNAYFLAGFPEMNLRDINHRQGRKPESQEIAHYLALRDSDADANYATALGFEPSDEHREDIEEYTPVPCPVCDNDTPPWNDLCVHCGHALTDAGADMTEDLSRDLMRTLAELGPDAVEGVLAAADVIEENPEVEAAINAMGSEDG